MRTPVATPTADIIRPFLWLAGLSFATGFLGFLAAAPYLTAA